MLVYAAITACGLISGCEGATDGATEQSVAPLTGTANITDFGAIKDDALDDRDAIQQALNSGAAMVFVPAGTYLIGTTHGVCNLNIPEGVTLFGAGATSILKQMANTPVDTRLIRFGAGGAACSDSSTALTKNVTIHDLTLDGNRAQQAPVSPGTDTHRVGIFAKGAQNLTVFNVTSRNFTDDGFYFYDRTCMTVTNVIATGNRRDGIVVSGGLKSCLLDDRVTTVQPKIADSTMVGNGVQQFDSEGGAEGNLIVTGNTIDGTGVSDYAMTVSGDDGINSASWQIDHNTITGSVRFVWTSNMSFTDNTVTNNSPHPAIEVQRSNGALVVRRNIVNQTQTTLDGLSAVWLSGTGVGSIPSATIIDNQLTVTGRAKSYGINAEGAGTFQAIHNTITGPALAAAGFAGVNIRASVIGDDYLHAFVHNNTIRNWGNYGVRMVGITTAPTARILVANITSNTFENTAGSAMTVAMSLNDDGAAAAKDVLVADNHIGTGISPTGATRALTGTHTTFAADRWVLPAP